MKRRLITRGFLAFATIVFSAAYSSASPMAGDTISLNLGAYQYGSGGEFLLESTSNDYAFVAFCLERNEYFRPGNSYTIENVDYFANNGGYGRDSASPAGKDYISNATKWLMNEYVFNYDNLWDGYTDQSYFAGLMQKTIWYLEDELTYLADYSLLNYAKDQMGSYFSELYTSDYLDNIQVVNLVTYGQDGKILSRHQSQLIANPVPEPATMLLLGTGLVGIAAISRRRSKS